MKILKFFESINQFREIDLQELWNDFLKYKSEFVDNSNIAIALVDDFKILFLDSIIINNKIDFQRTVHPYDDEVNYNNSGIVDKIIIEKGFFYFNVIVLVNNIKYNLIKIFYDINAINTKPDRIIRVYCDITENEEKLEILKNTNKYRL